MINEYLISKAIAIGDPLLLQKLKEKEENEKIIQEINEEQEESEIQSKYMKTVSENSMVGMKEYPDQIDSNNMSSNLNPYNSYVQNPYEDEKNFDVSDNRIIVHSRNNSFVQDSRHMHDSKNAEYYNSTQKLNYHNSVKSSDFLNPNHIERRRKSVNERSRTTINKNDSIEKGM